MPQRSGARLLPGGRVPPDFATEEEGTDWYLTHDTSELGGERVEMAPRTGLVDVQIRLPAVEIEELERRAPRLGIGYATYIRLLVNRHVLSEPPLK